MNVTSLITPPQDDDTQEIIATGLVLQALAHLDIEARARVLRSVAMAFIDPSATPNADKPRQM